METKLKSRAKEINGFWGDQMPLLCTEECGELVQAISKVERALIQHERTKESEDEFLRDTCRRRVGATKDGLMAEIADMYIVLSVLKERYDLSDDKINECIDRKLDRNY